MVFFKPAASLLKLVLYITTRIMLASYWVVILARMSETADPWRLLNFAAAIRDQWNKAGDDLSI